MDRMLLTAPGCLSRCNATTLARRVVRQVGITGGQVKIVSREFSHIGEYEETVYNIRGIPFRFLQFVDRVVWVVPAITVEGSTMQPWHVAHLFHVALALRLRAKVDYETILDPVEVESCDEKTPPPWYVRMCERLGVLNVWRRVTSVFTKARSAGG